MRAAARLLLEQFPTEGSPPLAPAPPAGPIAGKVNALEAPISSTAEHIPDRWTPEHVAKRIVEAFETLAKLPPIRGPRVPGNSWPETLVEWSDQLAQVDSDPTEQRSRQSARNRVRERPSSIDIRRMEIVLEWLSDLHRFDDGLARVVQRWAQLRARRKSIKADCRLTGLSFQIFYRQRDKGIARIVAAFGATPVW